MTDKVIQHMSNVREAYARLERLLPADMDRISEDETLLLVAERVLENLLESVFDALVVLAVAVGSAATGRRQAIERLGDHKVLTKEQADQFTELLALRNRLVHVYRHVAPENVIEMIPQAKRAATNLLRLADRVMSQRRTDG